MIELKCPHCGHQLRVRSKYAGKQGQCKHCQGFVDVPNTYAAEVEQEARRAAAELPTTPIHRPPTPKQGTALADLLGDDDPEPEPPAQQPAHEPTSLEDLTFDEPGPDGIKPTVPMAPDAFEAITGNDAPALPPYRRLGWYFWLLTIVLPPIAFIMAIRLPQGHPQKRAGILASLILLATGVAVVLLVFVGLPYAILSTWDTGDGTATAARMTINPPDIIVSVSPNDYVTVEALGPGGLPQDVVWSSSDSSVAEIVDNTDVSARVYGVAPGSAVIKAVIFATGEQALATVTVSPSSTTGEVASAAYAESGLPSYSDLAFREGVISDNYLEGSLATADPSALTTFVGHTAKDYEIVTNFFFQELQNRGWEIELNGYGDAANSETYIVANNSGYGLVYRTSADGANTKVVITIGPIQ